MTIGYGAVAIIILGIFLIFGVLLFGSDRTRSGTTDPNATANGAQANDRGWSVYLTVYSRERNIDADNNPRTYLNDTDLTKVSDAMTADFGAELAWFEGTPVILASPLSPGSPLAARVREFGDAPYAFVLAASGAGPGTAASNWFGKPIRWLDPAKLGWHLGVE